MCRGGPAAWAAPPRDFRAFPGCLQRTGSSCVSVHPGVFCKCQATSKDEAGGIRSLTKEGKARRGTALL